MSKISKVLRAGDDIYSASNGKPIKVTRVYSCGCDTEQGYFSYDLHRTAFYLTKRAYLDSKRSDNNA